MKLNNATVSDVLEVIAIDRSIPASPKTYFFGLTTSNEIAQTVETEKLRAGLGNTVFDTLKTSKDMTLTVAYGAASDDLMMLQTGGAFVNKDVSITVKETAQYVTATGLTITGTPVGTSVIVINATTGENLRGTFALGKVTVATTPPADGTVCHVVYEKALTEQEVLMFKGDQFPSNLELHLHGIAKKNSVIVADLYYVFYNAAITGNFTRSFQNGAPDPETIEFEIAAKDGTSDYGFYTVVARA